MLLWWFVLLCVMSVSAPVTEILLAAFVKFDESEDANRLMEFSRIRKFAYTVEMAKPVEGASNMYLDKLCEKNCGWTLLGLFDVNFLAAVNRIWFR